MTVVLENGSVVAERNNPAVSSALIKEVHPWVEGGAMLEDIIDRLRLCCVPSGYIP